MMLSCTLFEVIAFHRPCLYWGAPYVPEMWRAWNVSSLLPSCQRISVRLYRITLKGHTNLSYEILFVKAGTTFHELCLPGFSSSTHRLDAKRFPALLDFACFPLLHVLQLSCSSPQPPSSGTKYSLLNHLLLGLLLLLSQNYEFSIIPLEHFCTRSLQEKQLFIFFWKACTLKLSK